MKHAALLFMMLTVLTKGFCASATAIVGQTVEITVTASGTTPFTFAWMKNGVIIPGATSQTLTLAAVKSSDAGDYSAAVYNSAGSTVSDNASITVTPMLATLTANITSVNYPGPAILQWRKDGQSIPGANQPTYSFDPVAAPGAYSFTITWPNPPPLK
jgi:hypothetical protein